VAADELGPGEVGYVVANVRSVKETRAGDTILDAEHPAAQPLPGYQDVHSMVFAGLYPTDTTQYETLRDALDKLQLNDASLHFEPETSVALGFGFRCGFLGLLHMDIVQERLEREFDLDLVTTVPNVEYHVYRTDGSMEVVENPAKMPPAGVIARIEERYGFNQPILVQFADYWGRTLQWDLGESFLNRRSVNAILGERATASLRLAIWAIIIEIIIGIAVGLISAVKRYSIADSITTVGTAAAAAIPDAKTVACPPSSSPSASSRRAHVGLS
jgi:translation elongation factor EF-4